MNIHLSTGKKFVASISIWDLKRTLTSYLQEREMIPYCLAHGIGLIPWGPLAAGSLARPFGTDTVRESSGKGTVFEKKYSDADKTTIDRVEELAKKKGWTMGEVSLAWMMDVVASPIVGVSSVSRVRIRACELH